MNLISHISWLLILHHPVYSTASNHADSSLSFGPDYEYKFGTVPKRIDKRLNQLRGYLITNEPIRKPKKKGKLFDYHPRHHHTQVISTSPKPLKPPSQGYNNNSKPTSESTRTPNHEEKPNEYDSYDPVDPMKWSTTHLHHHHKHLPQINTEEKFPEDGDADDTAVPKIISAENGRPHYEKDNQENPDSYPQAKNIKKYNHHKHLSQINTEEKFPEGGGVGDPRKPKKKKKNIVKRPRYEKYKQGNPDSYNEEAKKKKKYNHHEHLPLINTEEKFPEGGDADDPPVPKNIVNRRPRYEKYKQENPDSYTDEAKKNKKINHHEHLPQINSEEKFSEDGGEGGKAVAKKIKGNRRPRYEKYEQENPDSDTHEAKKKKKNNHHKHKQQINTEDEYPEDGGAGDIPQNIENTRPHYEKVEQENPDITSTTQPHAPHITTRKRKWWEKIRDTVISWLDEDK